MQCQRFSIGLKSGNYAAIPKQKHCLLEETPLYYKICGPAHYPAEKLSQEPGSHLLDDLSECHSGTHNIIKRTTNNCYNFTTPY